MKYKGLITTMSIILIVDQLTKWLVVTRMELGESIPVIGSFFELMSHRNRGAAWGILQNQRVFFVIITAVILVGLLIWMWKLHRTQERWTQFALGLIISGAVGNLIDRATTGEVVDFLKFHFQGSIGSWSFDYVYPIFNVADAAIVIGAIWLVIIQFRADSDEKAASENKPLETEANHE